MFSPSRQQQLLRRGILDVIAHLERVADYPSMENYKALNESSLEFKEFVQTHVTAPEILAYIQTIPDAAPRPRKRGFLGKLFAPSTIFDNHSNEALALVKEWALDLDNHYRNLSFFVEAMELEQGSDGLQDH